MIANNNHSCSLTLHEINKCLGKNSFTMPVLVDNTDPDGIIDYKMIPCLQRTVTVYHIPDIDLVNEDVGSNL